MLYRLLASTAIVAGLALGGPLRAQEAAPADTATAETVVATVGETEITLGHMLALRRGLPEQYQQVAPAVLFKGVLDQLVRQTLLMQDHDGALSRDARLRLDNERRAILAADVARTIFDTQITDDAVRALYETRYSEAGGATEYKAAHILVETREEALSIIDELEAGANFAALAQEHSIGPSGPAGGDLGWFGEGVMVPAFFEAVAELGEGGVSAPLETQFGWHVIELRDTRVTERPEFSEVRGDLTAELRQQVFDEYVTRLEGETDVSRAGAQDVDPALINRPDLLED